MLAPGAISGTVTPPNDLQPAIDDLPDVGKLWLAKRCNGRAVLPQDIARAADFAQDVADILNYPEASHV